MHEKVLVIDDHLPSAQVLQWAMEGMGHEVRIALDGKSVTRETGDFVPDIVLCDLKLPDTSGYEICRRMRADPRFRHTLLLAQTGFDDRKSKEKSSEAGFHYHLVKPVDITKLFELVDLDRTSKARQQAIKLQAHTA